MLWQSGRRSSNVQNMRGLGGRTVGGAGGMFLIGIVVWALGGNPTSFFLEGASRAIQHGGGKSTLTAEQEAQQADFVSVVLASTEDVWNPYFNGNYPAPKLVLFTGYVDSACGGAQAAMGPFYCPIDQKAYLDLSFFQTMEDQLNAPGEFARAYVIAHEIGHHVQNITGAMDATKRRARTRAEANAISVQIELQADCLAGVWANGAGAMIEPRDIPEALNAASRIGDDTLQKQQQGYAVPDSFTHGTSAQRVEAFRRGYSSGVPSACGLN